MLLFDNSAWARLESSRLDEDRAEEISRWMEERQLATCLPFLLEAGYSTRSGREHAATMADLAYLPHVEINRDVEQLALGAQRELADIGHHRLAPVDVIIAACAHVAGWGVLHYDRDFDLLAEQTILSFESEWLAPPGTL
ncbi:MAG TPA: PIN domain-containing protein [Solirubrobacteraceae bacterium]